MDIKAIMRNQYIRGNRALLAFLARRREVLKRWRTRQPRTHIQVLGYPRSGTTLIYNMLCSCLADYEHDDWEKSATNVLWRYDNRVSKSPYDVFRVGEYAKANIHNKKIILILVIRDIRDIITSCHPFAPDTYMLSYDHANNVSGKYPNYVRSTSDRGIAAYHNAIRKIQQQSTYPVFTIHYEDLVNNPDREQMRMGSELSLSFIQPFSSYHESVASHGIRYIDQHRPLDGSLNKSSGEVSQKWRGRWQKPEHLERIREQFSRHPELQDILIGHGYEQNRDWLSSFLRQNTQ